MTLSIRSAYDAFFRRWGHRMAEAARGRRTFALLDELRAIDAMQPEERQAALDGLLAEAVRSAWHVPFYRSRFGRLGSDAEELATRRGLRRLPILTKEDLRRDPEALISTRASRKPHTTRTAGSTGQPLCAYVEILDDEDQPVRPGQTGRVVVTLLRCSTVPLLRYDTGDLAQELEGHCSCGRPHRLIGRVQGRAYDLIRAADGSVAPGVAFTHGMKYLSSVRRYQVIQRQVDRVDILYETCGTVPPEELSAARSRIESAIGAKFRIRFQQVDHLGSEASGKFRWIRSEVPDRKPERRVAP